MSDRDADSVRRFEREVVPHLDSAYNLARWLTGNDADAEDIMQEAAMRAFRFSSGRRSADDARAWLLQIVRNASYTWLRKTSRYVELPGGFDVADPERSPEERLRENVTAAQLRTEIERLSPEFREVIVLREIDEISYQEIADVAGIPMGTVMSRLARARAQVRDRLSTVTKGT